MGFTTNDFNKKRLLKPDFATIKGIMAEARALKTSSSSYKKQMEDLMAASNKLLPAEEEEGPLLKKGKVVVRPSSKAPIVARPAIR